MESLKLLFESDKIEFINSILSIGAIIVSIIAIENSNMMSEKTHKRNLNVKFFEEIYFDDIAGKLPIILAKIQTREGDFIEHCNECNDIIVNMIQKSYFYKFFDSEFYEKVKYMLIELDENLIMIKDVNIDSNLYDKEIYKINDNMDELYKFLKEYYSEI